MVFVGLLPALYLQPILEQPTKARLFGASMTDKQKDICTHLKGLGYAKGKQIKLYGEVLNFLGDPIVVNDEVVVVDAQDDRTGESKRIRIPLPVVNVARRGGMATGSGSDSGQSMRKMSRGSRQRIADPPLTESGSGKR